MNCEFKQSSRLDLDERNITLSGTPIATLSLFGKVRLRRTGSNIDCPLTGKSVEILTCLGMYAVFRETGVTAEELDRIVWHHLPDAENARAKALSELQTTLINYKLPGSAIKTSGKQKWLDLSIIAVDAVNVKRTLEEPSNSSFNSLSNSLTDEERRLADEARQRSLQEAVDQSSGELAGKVLAEKDTDFKAVRDRVKRLAVDARYELAMFFEGVGKTHNAEDYANQALDISAKHRGAINLLRRLRFAQSSERIVRYLPKMAKAIESFSQIQRQLPTTLQTRSAVWMQRKPPIYGRSADVAALLDLINHSSTTKTDRIITLTGTGGSGKTRLALQVCDDLEGTYGHSVIRVSLADVTTSDDFWYSILLSLNLQSARGVTLREQVLRHLSSTSSILFLDNFDELVSVGSELMLGILERCQHVVCLVTSRSRLGMSYAECEWKVDPLPTPNLLAELDSIEDCPSVKMLSARSRHAGRDRPSLDCIAKICVILDGLPLALELAAELLNLYKADELISELTKTLTMLESSHNNLPDRHKSLKACMEVTYHQLRVRGLDEAFERLAYFRCPWNLDAMKAILETTDCAKVLELLQVLSVLKVDMDGKHTRYSMLNIHQCFGREKLVQRGELDRVADIHAQIFCERASLAELDWATLAAEHEDFLVALEQTIVRPDSGIQAMSIIRLLGPYWISKRFTERGLSYATQVLSLSEPPIGTYERAVVFNVAGRLAVLSDNIELATTYFETSFRERAAYVDGAEYVDIRALVLAFISLGDLKVITREYDKAVRVYQCGISSIRSMIAYDNGEIEALHVMLVDALFRFSEVERELGCFKDCYDHLAECLSICRNDGLWSQGLNVQQALGRLALAQQEHKKARKIMWLCWKHARKAINLEPDTISEIAANLAKVSIETGRVHSGVRWLRIATKQSEAVSPHLFAGYLCDLSKAQFLCGMGTQSVDTMLKCLRITENHNLDWTLVKVLLHVIEIEPEGGSVERAQALLDALYFMETRINNPAFDDTDKRIHQHANSPSTVLDKAEYDSASEREKVLTTKAVIELLRAVLNGNCKY